MKFFISKDKQTKRQKDKSDPMTKRKKHEMTHRGSENRTETINEAKIGRQHTRKMLNQNCAEIWHNNFCNLRVFFRSYIFCCRGQNKSKKFFSMKGRFSIVQSLIIGVDSKMLRVSDGLQFIFTT